MNTDVIVALIAFVGTLIGSLSGVIVSARLTNYRIAQLEHKVDRHNHFAERIPVLEEQIKIVNHRIDDIERNL